MTYDRSWHKARSDGYQRLSDRLARGYHLALDVLLALVPEGREHERAAHGAALGHAAAHHAVRPAFIAACPLHLFEVALERVLHGFAKCAAVSDCQASLNVGGCASFTTDELSAITSLQKAPQEPGG
jgi:hypothetical protein